MKTLQQLIEDPKCLIVHNHSGGKDSDISYLFIKNLVPSERLIVVHADLGEMDWEGTEEHIREIIEPHHKFYICQAGKTFFEMVLHRKMFPSPSTRQCTSDLKRGPIQKVIIGHCNEHGFDKVVNVMGLRAEESSGRKKKPVFQKIDSRSNSKREWYEWLPIHALTTEQVFEGIAAAGKKPHWVYAAGMKRKSCKICIFSTREDICTSAKIDPEFASKVAKLERELDFTMTMPIKGEKQFLDQILKQ